MWSHNITSQEPRPDPERKTYHPKISRVIDGCPSPCRVQCIRSVTTVVHNDISSSSISLNTRNVDLSLGELCRVPEYPTELSSLSLSSSRDLAVGRCRLLYGGDRTEEYNSASSITRITIGDFITSRFFGGSGSGYGWDDVIDVACLRIYDGLGFDVIRYILYGNSIA